MPCCGSREVLLVKFHATPKSLWRARALFSGSLCQRKFYVKFPLPHKPVINSDFNFSVSQLGDMSTSKHPDSSLQRKKLFLQYFSLQSQLIFPGLSSTSTNVNYWSLSFSRCGSVTNSSGDTKGGLIEPELS